MGLQRNPPGGGDLPGSDEEEDPNAELRRENEA